MESPGSGSRNEVAEANILERYTDTCKCGACDDIYYCGACAETYSGPHSRDDAIVHSLMHTMNGDKRKTRARR